MFVQFLIATMAIIVAGPLEIEGGKEAVLEQGIVPALERAWDQRDTEAHADQSRYNN